MYCRYCGRELNEGANFCTSCGAAVVLTAQPDQPAQPPYIAPQQIAPPYVVPQQQNVQPYVVPQQQIVQSYVAPTQNVVRHAIDAPSFGYAILCFIWPILGLVLYLVWHDQYPLRAKSCGKGAIANIIANVALSIIIAIICMSAVFSSDFYYHALSSFVGAL